MTTPTEPAGLTGPAGRRRLAVVLARHAAVAPPGTGPDAFAAAALADSYEVAADLIGVDATIAGPASAAELLYPGVRLLPAEATLAELSTAALDQRYEEVVFLPGDAPDLPGLVIAKLFKALYRAAVAIAPQRGGTGCLAIGVRLPIADWLELPADLDTDPRRALQAAAPRRSQVAITPDWHRLRTAEDVRTRLDPALEGWDETRLLLGR